MPDRHSIPALPERVATPDCYGSYDRKTPSSTARWCECPQPNPENIVVGTNCTSSQHCADLLNQGRLMFASAIIEPGYRRSAAKQSGLPIPTTSLSPFPSVRPPPHHRPSHNPPDPRNSPGQTRRWLAIPRIRPSG